MKTTCMLILLLASCSAMAQIPSINETQRKVSAQTFKDQSLATAASDSIWDKGVLSDLPYKVTDGRLQRNNTYQDLLNKTANEKLNSIDATNLLPEHYLVYIERFRQEITNLKSQIEKLEKSLEDADSEQKERNILDNIVKCQTKIEVREIVIAKLVSRKNNTFSRFPSFHKRHRKAFFTDFFHESEVKTNYLNNLAFVFGSTTVQSELVSDYAGPFRLSFGTVVSADKQETEESETEERNETSQEEENQADLKRILNGGGNFYLDIMLPLHCQQTPGQAFSELTTLNLNLSTDLEGVGSDVATSDVKALLKMSTYLALSSDNKKFNFFFNADYGMLTGSKAFREQFALEDFNVKPCMIGKAILGMTLENKIRITVTSKSFSNYRSMISDRVMVGVQLLK